jgi:hypothetical protein
MRGGLFMGPLKKYITGHSLQESYEDIPVKIAKHYPELYKTAVFKDVHDKIVSEFNTLIKNSDRESLKKNYKGNDDLFSFGITILQIVVREKLDYNKYSRLIAMLTSYLKPVSATRLV